MNKTRLQALLIVCVAAISSLAFGKNVLSITDDAIVYPNSIEANTAAMRNNWYLKNYAVMDADVEKHNPETVSDHEYERRLKAIPSAIELTYNPIVKSHIERYVTKGRTHVEQMLGLGTYYMPIFEQALSREGLPLDLKYLPIIESALDPTATSRSGAAGLWQFMIDTGKDMGLEINDLVDERRDPYRSSQKAAEYLASLYNIYNDWHLALAAYNCGSATVNKALKRNKNNDNSFWGIYELLPKETRGYVPAFIATVYVMNYYREHNISPSLAKKPLFTDTVNVSRRVSFSDISKALDIPMDELRILNPQYKNDIIPGDYHPYSLTLPSQQIYSYVLIEDNIGQTDNSGKRPRIQADSYAANSGDSYSDTSYSDSYSDTGNKVASSFSSSSSTTQQNRPEKQDQQSTGGTGTHKVKKGESVTGIAFAYGMTPDELMDLNNLESNVLEVGQTLRVVERKAVDGYQAQNTQPKRQQPAKTESVPAPQPKPKAENKPAPKPAPKAESKPASQPKPAATQSSAKANTKKTNTKTDSGAGYKGSHSVNDEIKRDKANAAKAKAAEKTAEKPKTQPKQEQKPKAQAKAQTKQTGKKRETNKKRESADNKKSNSGKVVSHTVKPGDSLEKIARENNTTVRQIMEDNNLKSDLIIDGHKLKVRQNTKPKTTTNKNRRNDDDDRVSSKKKTTTSKGRRNDDDDRVSSKKKTTTSKGRRNDDDDRVSSKKKTTSSKGRRNDDDDRVSSKKKTTSSKGRRNDDDDRVSSKKKTTTSKGRRNDDDDRVSSKKKTTSSSKGKKASEETTSKKKSSKK